MLINKEKQIGVSAIFASEEYDKGDIIFQSSSDISYPIKISEAIDIVSKNYTKVIGDIFSSISQGNILKSTSQDNKLATYSLWRGEEDYFIDWSKSSSYILNFINSVSFPYRGASAYIGGSMKVRILDAYIEDDVEIVNRNIGKVIFTKGGFPVVVCGKGLLRLTSVVDDETRKNILPLKSFRIKFNKTISST